MLKFKIFRTHGKADRQFEKHELIAIEYGENIYNVLSKINDDIKEDIVGSPKYTGNLFDIYGPDDCHSTDRYSYTVEAVIQGATVEQDRVVLYGILTEQLSKNGQVFF